MARLARLEEQLVHAQPRNTLFTGSSKVADMLARDLNGKVKLEGSGFNWKRIWVSGKVKLEGSGFNWKLLGPDVPDTQNQEYVAHVCDQ
ncbi:hypothetical protein T484DRAFT_1786822, partial [Baffinella frigidus]